MAGLIGPAGRACRAPRAVAAETEAVATARQQAAAWVAGQISRSAIVACDPAMCADLQRHGFPAGDLLMLGPGAPDPLGSDVVVATAAVRSQFGGRLAGVYAPLMLAAFGTGGAAIEVRAIAPDGVAAFRDALAGELAARQQAGAELLRNPGISAPAAAGRQLSDGMVDSRLLITLAALAGLRSATQPPIRIISFGGPAPAPARRCRCVRSRSRAPPRRARSPSFGRSKRRTGRPASRRSGSQAARPPSASASPARVPSGCSATFTPRPRPGPPP